MLIFQKYPSKSEHVRDFGIVSVLVSKVDNVSMPEILNYKNDVEIAVCDSTLNNLNFHNSLFM